MRVLHLEASARIRSRFRDLMEVAGHTVCSFDTYTKAKKNKENFDLYVVGNLNGVLGPDFALEKKMDNKRVLMLAQIQKLSRMPFASYDVLSDSNSLKQKIAEIMAGDQ